MAQWADFVVVSTRSFFFLKVGLAPDLVARDDRLTAAGRADEIHVLGVRGTLEQSQRQCLASTRDLKIIS